eukprot:COSAG01_NODE_19322_length_1017_cov_2.766885_1_plen_197_part_10
MDRPIEEPCDAGAVCLHAHGGGCQRSNAVAVTSAAPSRAEHAKRPAVSAALSEHGTSVRKISETSPAWEGIPPHAQMQAQMQAAVSQPMNTRLAEQDLQRMQQLVAAERQQLMNERQLRQHVESKLAATARMLEVKEAELAKSLELLHESRSKVARCEAQRVADHELSQKQQDVEDELTRQKNEMASMMLQAREAEL